MAAKVDSTIDVSDRRTDGKTAEEVAAGWSIRKRGGEVVPFDCGKIRSAVSRCFTEVGLTGVEAAATVEKVTKGVVNTILAKKETPDVETVQRYVVQQLFARGLFDAGEHYQNYREQHRKARAARPVPPEVAARVRDDQAHFPLDGQYYQFMSKFSRWREGDRRRETWAETVRERVMPWLFARPEARGKLTPGEQAELTDAVFALDVSPAMRVVQMAGPALDRCNSGAYNCSYLPIKDVFAFPELLYTLMQGCGVGFSVESDYVSELPRVKKQRGGKPETVTVEDTTEGWCDALFRGLQLWWDGHDAEADVTAVRPKGSRLKTKGGRSSGPGPFLEMWAFARNLFKSRQGRFLEDVDCHDLACYIGKIVQVGGVRRAAEISLSDLGSRAMRDAKSGNWYATAVHRTMANNSAVYEEKPTIEVFMEEWLSLVKSKSGERGIFNRAAHNRHKPQRRREWKFGSNPCFTGDTKVWTIYGPRRFDELTGTETPVLSQGADGRLVFRMMRGIQRTRRNAKVFKVRTRSLRGRHGWRYGGFTATADHVIFMRDGTETPVAELKPGDRLSSVYRSKANQKRYLALRNSAGDVDMEHRIVMSWEHGFRPDYPAYHVDHINEDKANNNPENLRVLTSEEHNGTRMKGGKNPMVRFPEKNPFRSPGFNAKHKPRGFAGRHHTDETRRKMSDSHHKNRTPNNHEVVSVEYVGRADVYDGTVDETHRFFVVTEKDGGVLVHNCGEIVLRPFQFCNLSIAVARPDDTIQSLTRKVRLATILGKIQSLATDFKYIRPDWKRNCDEERLLGVDITGHADCPLLRWGAADRHLLLNRLNRVVEQTDLEYSKRFGVNRSAANTCVKPGGDSAFFFNCASGVSPRFSRYGVRWVREPKDTPVARFLKDSGVPCADAPEAPNELYVFGFPALAPEGCTVRDDMTAEDQFRNWLDWNRNWAEHSVSATIYVGEDEWLRLGALVYEHFDEVTGLAFLPRDNGRYTYPPNEALTEGDYQKFIASFPDINWAKLPEYEEDDQTTSRQTIACFGGKCD